MIKATEIKLKHIQINDSWSFSDKIAPSLHELLASFNPCYLIFSSPTSFHIFFYDTIAGGDLDKIIDNITNYLKSKRQLLEHTFVRYLETTYTCEIDNKNNIVSLPMGGVDILKPSNVVFEIKQ